MYFGPWLCEVNRKCAHLVVNQLKFEPEGVSICAWIEQQSLSMRIGSSPFSHVHQVGHELIKVR